MREMFKKEMERRNISNKDMAKKVNISEGQLSSNLNGKTSKAMGFSLFVKFVRVLFPDQERELVAQYIPKLDKVEYIKQAFEYAAFHKYHQITALIFENDLCKKASLKDWVFCYEKFMNLQLGLITHNEFQKIAEENVFKDYDLQLMKRFAQVRGHYLNKRYNFVKEMCEVLIEEAVHIKDEFIKKYYNTRFKTMLAYSRLYSGDLVDSREHIEVVIRENLDELVTANSYHSLGLSFMYTNKDKALENLYYAKNIFKAHAVESECANVQDSINAIENFYGKVVDEVYCTDLLSLARNASVNNEHHKALGYLAKVRYSNLNTNNKAFYKYIEGMTNGDKTFSTNQSSCLKSVMTGSLRKITMLCTN